MYTRKQYLNKEVSHQEYYLEIAQECRIDYSDSKLLPRIITCLESGDKYLNTISLKLWNSRSIMTQSVIHKTLKKRGDFWSLASGVCVHKSAARKAGLDFMESEN